MKGETWAYNTQRILHVNTTRIALAAISGAMLVDKEGRAARLRAAIKNAGFKSLAEAAARHHFKEPTLTSHSNGNRAFDIETGYRYAMAFKVDPAWLLGVRDEPGAPKSTAGLFNAQSIAPILGILMELAPDTDSSGKGAEALAVALRHAIALLPDNGANEATADQIAEASRAAVVRFREAFRP